jgi:hypothetical protein
MKTESESESKKVQRRSWLGSVAAVGAAVAGTVALTRRNPVAEVVVNADAAKPDSADSAPNSGYQLTEHVKRYYATARV